jgi:xylulokinase
MDQQKKYIVAHDVGTTGDKAVLTDMQGNIVFSSYLPYDVEYPQPDWAEQDPDMLWQATANNTRQMIQKSGIDPKDIIGVGLATQMLNVIPVDEAGKPLHKMISWLDVRSTKQADGIYDTVTPQFFFKHSGNLPTAKDTIPRMLWLKEERPDIWKRTFKLLDCGGYLNLQLTGKYATDWHGASITYLFDPYDKVWSEPLCNALGIPKEKLVPAFRCIDVIGEVTPSASVLTGLIPGTPVVACAGDLGVAQVGSGAVKDGEANLYIGTSSWIGFSTSVFNNNPEKPFWGLNHVDPKKWIIAGEMETGGGSYNWFMDTFCQEEATKAKKLGITTYKLLDQMAETIPPGSDRLIYLPWLTGERSPVLDHYLRGAFFGMTLGHTKAHFARAVLEGVAFHFRWICEELGKLGYKVSVLKSIGGGSKSPTWTKIISDITGCQLQIAAHPLEAGAMGAALTVAVGLGIYPDIESVGDLIPFVNTVTPSDVNANRYDRLYQEYRNLHKANAPIFRQIHDVP